MSDTKPTTKTQEIIARAIGRSAAGPKIGALSDCWDIFSHDSKMRLLYAAGRVVKDLDRAGYRITPRDTPRSIQVGDLVVLSGPSVIAGRKLTISAIRAQGWLDFMETNEAGHVSDIVWPLR